MDFKNAFSELAEKYNLTYRYQEFNNCSGGNWFVCTHSLYNETGCFTVQYLPQRGEVGCFFSRKFSAKREFLCHNEINVFAAEKEIWDKKEKIWIFKNPFYYWSPKRTIKTLIQVIECSINKNEEFFGIKIK